MKPLPSDDELARAVREQVPGIRTAWLFGSAARGTLRPDSDIDIAVWRREPLDALERYDAASALAYRWGRDVDLLDFARLSPVMQVQVLDGGRVLFDEDPVATVLDTARVIRDWQDLQRWRRPQRRALAERLQRQGAT